MRRTILMAAVLCLAAATTPASAGTAEVQLSNARTAGFNGYANWGSGYMYAGFNGYSAGGVAVNTATPPSGPPTVTQPASGGSIYFCSSSVGCEFGNLPANFTLPTDPALAGGSINATAQSGTYTGGTITVTLDYAGVGAHAYGGGVNWNGSNTANLPTFVTGSALVLRNAVFPSMVVTSSTLGTFFLPAGSGYLANGVNGYAYNY